MDEEQKPLDDSLKILAKSSVIIFIGIFLSKVLSYVFRAVIARYMGPEVYGLFTLSTAVTELFAAIFCLGLLPGLVRYVSIYRGKNDQAKINYVIKTTVTIVASSGFVGGIILFMSSRFISLSIFNNPKLFIFLISFSFALPISVLGIIFLTIMQSYEKMNYYAFIRNVLFNLVELIVIILGILSYFLYFNKNDSIFPYVIIASYIFGHMSIAIPSYFYCKYRIKEVFYKYNLSLKEKARLRKDLFSYSWPLLFVGLISLLFAWTDAFMIGIFKDAFAVGIYNVAVPIAMLMIIAPQLFLYLFLPIITKEYARNNHYLIKESSQQVGKWIFMLNLPILIIILMFPGTIINVLFGPNYLSAQWPLRFLGIGMLFYSIFSVSDNLLSMIGKSKTIMYNMIITVIINIALDVILIPMPSLFGLDNSQGLVGASIATMVSYIIWSILTMLLAMKYAGIIPLRKKILTITLVTLIPTVLIFFTKNIFPKNILYLILQGILFIFIYLVLIIITGCLDKNDVMIIRSIKEKLNLNGGVYDNIFRHMFGDMQ